MGLYTPRTQTSDSERAALVHFARGQTRLAEIGVYQGVTTALLSSVMDEQGVYFAVDPHPGGALGFDFNYLIARREVSRSARGKVVWIKARGADAPHDPRLRGEEVGFLFIDGDHSYDGLRGDWEAWRGLVSPGGVIALHDTRGGRFGCQRYMEDAIAPDPDLDAEVASLTVFRRKMT